MTGEYCVEWMLCRAVGAALLHGPVEQGGQMGRMQICMQICEICIFA